MATTERSGTRRRSRRRVRGAGLGGVSGGLLDPDQAGLRGRRRRSQRAALLYSFACLVLIHFVERSPFPEPVNVAAVSFPLLFFGVAIATYIRLGWRGTTDNAFERRDFSTTTGMWLLGVSEISGFVVLLAGFLRSQLG